jgi:N-acetyl-gamma-glutamyl-phosphate reductase
VASHRHTPEIEEQLSYVAGEPVLINFTPHLVPMNRGILVTAYANLKPDKEGNYPTAQEVREVYETRYADEKFVRVLKNGVCPQTRWVEGSNYTDVNAIVDERTHRVIMMGALDNIVKGAAGQAVQNMNLMFGLEESEGLDFAPLFP